MRRLLRSSVNLLPHAVRFWVKHLPIIAAWQRWVVNRVLAGQPFVHTINAGPAAGLRFEVTLPLDKAIWAGIYESEFAKAIAQRVKLGDVCYDIGGYRGYMSGTMALAGASKVIVFEPLPANQEALRRLCDLNPKLPVEIKPFAVGESDGSIQLKVMPDASMGKLITSPFQADAASQGEIEVIIHRVDSLVAKGEAPLPDLIKVDVEGAEVDVLRGATAVIRKRRPIIFLEAHSNLLEDACTRELSLHGYKIHRLEAGPIDEAQTRHLIANP